MTKEPDPDRVRPAWLEWGFGRRVGSATAIGCRDRKDDLWTNSIASRGIALYRMDHPE